jgi:hypothetical protein
VSLSVFAPTLKLRRKRNVFVAKNIKNIATKTPNHKDFTKKNKRNALNQKSKTAS